jgi:NTP pyrophosphatase (non-canonical NTP hydrolase)
MNDANRPAPPIVTEARRANGYLYDCGRELQGACYGASIDTGWHTDPVTKQPRTAEQNDALFPTRIALCHSELSEALEGHRKGLMDDKLPHRRMAEVELADTAIRVFDLAGAMGYDLGAAIAEKLAYNRQRADHTHEARLATGGKKY